MHCERLGVAILTSDSDLTFSAFVSIVLDALSAANIPYLIGGAVAVWAWGEPRTTQDLDLVIELPFESMLALSKELEARDMLVPVENMVDLMIEDRADLPISAMLLSNQPTAQACAGHRQHHSESRSRA